ncbi:hypothetical protein C0J52_15005, partial [Blattella germanica]
MQGICDRIEHKFLMSGHIFSALDRDFALIEKRAKCSKMQTMEDIKIVISIARPSRPYRVKIPEKANSHASALQWTEGLMDYSEQQDAPLADNRCGVGIIRERSTSFCSSVLCARYVCLEALELSGAREVEEEEEEKTKLGESQEIHAKALKHKQDERLILFLQKTSAKKQDIYNKMAVQQSDNNKKSNIYKKLKGITSGETSTCNCFSLTI